MILINLDIGFTYLNEILLQKQDTVKTIVSDIRETETVIKR